jgi:hypothetical protein
VGGGIAADEVEHHDVVAEAVEQLRAVEHPGEVVADRTPDARLQLLVGQAGPGVLARPAVGVVDHHAQVGGEHRIDSEK